MTALCSGDRSVTGSVTVKGRMRGLRKRAVKLTARMHSARCVVVVVG